MKLYKKDFTNAKYAELAIYCNENNFTIEDKGDYLESIENKINLKELKENKILEFDIITRNFIYNKYSDIKQRNIDSEALTALLLNTDDLEEKKQASIIMRNWINDIRNKFKIFKDKINLCTTKEQLDNIIINFIE